MANVIEFPRGDTVVHTFSIPAANWSSGGRLFFAAKPAVDDDAGDAAAVINKSWDDSAVSDVTIDNVAYKQYACHFAPSDTNSIPSNGADSTDYLGEFQWVDAGGNVTTFPPNDPKLGCIVYFDVKRGTS